MALILVLLLIKTIVKIMKRKVILYLLILSVIGVYAQKKSSEQSNANEASSSYGNVLNASLGSSYGGSYYGQSYPVLINYEINIAKNATLAPFISFYTYKSHYLWGSPGNNKPYKDYFYRTTVIPIGVKGSYYFDELLMANSKWDFYLAASIGFAYRKTTWDDGYAGPVIGYTTSGAYGDIHAGAEYHVNEKIGMFLDLSSGVSSLGISIKTK